MTQFDEFTQALPQETEDASYIGEALVFDWLWNFCHDNKEYREPRELGVVAEYVEMHRKVKKLKFPLLEGGDTNDWREPPRKILMELISHAFLALVDLDKASGIDPNTTKFRLLCKEPHVHNQRRCWGIANGSH